MWKNEGTSVWKNLWLEMRCHRLSWVMPPHCQHSIGPCTGRQR
jgi:hypothetical protein